MFCIFFNLHIFKTFFYVCANLPLIVYNKKIFIKKKVLFYYKPHKYHVHTYFIYIIVIKTINKPNVNKTKTFFNLTIKLFFN